MTALRGLSLGLAALVGFVILRHPEWTADAVSWTVRGGLAVALVGLIGATAYGFGHAPNGRVLQFAQSPKVAWPAMLAGLMVITIDRFL